LKNPLSREYDHLSSKHYYKNVHYHDGITDLFSLIIKWLLHFCIW